MHSFLQRPQHVQAPIPHQSRIHDACPGEAPLAWHSHRTPAPCLCRRAPQHLTHFPGRLPSPPTRLTAIKEEKNGSSFSFRSLSPPLNQLFPPRGNIPKRENKREKCRLPQINSMWGKGLCAEK